MENSSAPNKKWFRKIYYLRSLLLAALKGKYLQEWYDSHSGREDLNARFMLKYTDCKSRLGLQYRESTREIYFPFWKTSQAEMLAVGSMKKKPGKIEDAWQDLPHLLTLFCARWVGARNKDCSVVSRLLDQMLFYCRNKPQGMLIVATST